MWYGNRQAAAGLPTRISACCYALLSIRWATERDAVLLRSVSQCAIDQKIRNDISAMDEPS